MCPRGRSRGQGRSRGLDLWSKKTKLSIYKTVFVSILTYGHEFWVMT